MTPKSKFQAAPNFREVASLINSPLLEHCLEVALLTLVANIGEAQADAHAAQMHYELSGAKRFIATLKGLAIIPSEPKPNRIGQLGPQ